jgi:tripartite-type tricarboxylate transporter receptor subunit TctC
LEGVTTCPVRLTFSNESFGRAFQIPSKTIPEFIAYAKASPGKLNMASGGNGSIAHLSATGSRS